jgi:hypothetical protein
MEGREGTAALSVLTEGPRSIRFSHVEGNPTHAETGYLSLRRSPEGCGSSHPHFKYEGTHEAAYGGRRGKVRSVRTAGGTLRAVRMKIHFSVCIAICSSHFAR